MARRKKTDIEVVEGDGWRREGSHVIVGTAAPLDPNFKIVERPIRIGFTGTRNGMTNSQIANIKAVLPSIIQGRPWQAVHGDCVGADAQFHVIAKELGATVVILPPSNPTLRAYCEGDVIHDPAPYAKRNKAIVDESDVVIGAPGQSNNPGYGGTWQTIRFAQDADKLYGIVIPNGAIIEP